MKMHQITILLLLIIPIFSSAQDSRSVKAERVESAPKIDGELNEDIWTNLSVVNNFTQYYPRNNDRPSNKTEVKLCYDNFAVYIGIKCFADPDSLKMGISERDVWNLDNNEAVGILLSPYNDGVNSLYFFVSSSNVQSDRKITGMNIDSNWNAVWYSEVSTTDDGWIAEIKIPYSALRFSNTDIQDWGFNIWRWNAAKSEWSSWQYVSNEINGWWKVNGKLTGLKYIEPPLRLSITPYFSAYAENNTDGDWENTFNGGMDLKLGLSESFTLDMTLIPDFGQVQSDDKQLNLSPFELYYNEKRQFFTEGTELFNKGDIFYSRRIGTKPKNSGAPSDNLYDDETVDFNPSETKLINATKISGRTQNGLGIGFLNAMTSDAFAEIKDTISGRKRGYLTQPFTNYNVSVLDQTLLSNSYISLINTNLYNDSHVANVTAAVVNFTNKENTYNINAVGAISYIKDEANDSTGQRFELELGKIGGKLQYGYEMSVVTDKYDHNDLGFLYRNNYFNQEALISYNIFKPFGIFLNMENELNFYYNRMIDPNVYSEFLVSYEFHTEFKNRYSFNMHAAWAPLKEHDYYESRVEGRYLKLNKWFHNCASLSSDVSKPVSFDIHGAFKNSYDFIFNTKSWSLGISSDIKIGNRFKIGINTFYSEANNQAGYVDKTDDNQTIYFGKRDRQTVNNRLTLSYIFTNKIGLNLKLRHYWSNAKYDSFYELTNDGNLVPSIYNENNDLNYNAFNIDMTFRWEFAPGSELRINWKNAIEADDDGIITGYIDNINHTFDQLQVNSFSIKLLYYLDYNRVKSWFK
ncbi:MAG: carbohydrate binding family 9 domain-containing protein [bacterium]|nr:carbohydrate binding family 9 domain-containing protein [bacterium]